jgi:hypothetical protein
MKTGPSEAAFLARLVSWLNSRLDNVVIVIGGTPVCRGKSVVYKRYYNTSSFVNAVLLSCSEASSSPASSTRRDRQTGQAGRRLVTLVVTSLVTMLVTFVVTSPCRRSCAPWNAPAIAPSIVP